MKPASSWIPACATALLHAALIALVIAGLRSVHHGVTPPKPVSVQLLQEPKRPTPPAPLPVAPVEPPRDRPPPKYKRPASSTPAHSQAPATTQARASEAPPVPAAPATSNAAASAPSAPSLPVAQAPTPPVKTGVSIPANYATGNRKPPYPRLSRQREEQGTVELRVFVNPDGTAAKVEIASTSGYPLLDESARSTVQTWRFSPATVDGKPVGEWYRVPVPFKLQD